MTRFLGAVRSIPVAGSVAVAALLVIAGVVLASGTSSPITVCVPVKEGKPIITPKGGVCRKGFTLTEVGKEGPEGKEGPAGAEGPPSTAVIVRAHNPAPVASGTAVGFTTIPIEGQTWNQTSEELDSFAGEATVTIPSESECTDGFDGDGAIQVLLDGTEIGSIGLVTHASEETVTKQFRWEGPTWLTVGKLTTQTLSARVWNRCGEVGSGDHTGGHFTLNSIKIDVVGAH